MTFPRLAIPELSFSRDRRPASSFVYIDDMKINDLLANPFLPDGIESLARGHRLVELREILADKIEHWLVEMLRAAFILSRQHYFSLSFPGAALERTRR